MEDDDEFGDLYTDVLRPFSSASTASSSPAVAPQPHHQPPPAAPPHLNRPIDLKLQSRDDDSALFGAPRPIPATQTLVSFKSPPPPPAVAQDSIPRRDSATEPIALDSNQELSDGKDVKFDIEEGPSNGVEDIGSDDPIIPGLTDSVRQEDSGRNNGGRNENGIRGGQAEAEGEGDDWDSDSEDDLQIVLNDNNHGPMAMERGGMMGEDDDDDEDGDPLVIVADGDANQGMEDQEWGEEGAQAADGERKEGGEAGKAGGAGGGGSVVAPKIGYSNHGYHPFHSQFKVSVLTC